MGDASTTTAELRILSRLGLAQLAIADQLVLVLKHFRAAQLRDLESTLVSLPDHVIAHMQDHFDRKLDVREELERYAQDLLKATHLVRHLQIDGDAQREIETLLGAMGDAHDRALLLKILQALGAKLAHVLCGFCLQLPTLKLQQVCYRVFAATTEAGMDELKLWMQWLENCKPRHGDAVLAFVTKCTTEHCLAQWLQLLKPLASSMRVTLIQRLFTADATLFKQIGRFHEVTNLPIAKLMDLCAGFHAELGTVFAEFPMATTLTLYAKFNDDRVIGDVVKALYLLGKGEVIRLIDALASEESVRAIQIFFTTVTHYARRRAIASVWLSLSKPSQSRLLEFTLHASTAGHDNRSGDGDPSVVFDFLLDSRFRSVDEVLRKLSSMSKDKVAELVKAMRFYTVDERVLLGKGIEAIHNAQCLETFFRLFDLLLPAQRSVLVDWVHDMPGEEVLQLYDKIFELHASAQLERLANLLEMIASLSKADKNILCVRLLRRPTSEEERVCIDATNDAVLKYLCGCEASRRHKTVKLLNAIDHASYDALLFLLRTQRMPEQIVLTKVMLSLSPDANARLLAKLQGLDGDTLDEFFQLLMLIPKVEYKMIARLLVSQEVSLEHFQDFVHVAANMMNQAATREMVIFAAELPPRYRNLFFDMLGQCTGAEKGVVMRIVACSTRLSPDMLQLFVELLLRMAWETRSALVEQLRALEESTHIETYVAVLREFDEDAYIPCMVHLLNLVTLPVRIALVSLFAHMNSMPERAQALTKLHAMRKDHMPAYCSALCDPFCLRVISGNYLRVFGYLQDDYQAGMLKLLRWKSCWVFIEALAATIDATTPSATSDDSMGANSALVNGLAASLTMLDEEDDYVMLGDVMEEALGNGTRLEELIVVLAHFRNRERLLMFLKYVVHLARHARSTLFFRVLSRSHATEFLFDMCHVLDLDDALFALKRLDRMWSRDADAADSMLTTLAWSGTAVDSRDEFCNLVLGYQERTPLHGATRDRVVDRVVQPRRVDLDLHPLTANSVKSWLSEIDIGAGEERELDLSSRTTTSLRPIPVMKQLERVQDRREDARRRRRCRNWRGWTQADWDDALLRSESPGGEKSLSMSRTTEAASDANDVPYLIRAASSPELSTRPSEGNLTDVPENMPGSEAEEVTSEASPVIQPFSQSSTVVLPPLALPLPPIDISSHPISGHNNRPISLSVSEDAVPDNTRGLSHSKSAPVSLYHSSVSRTKQNRGLHAGLGLDEATAYHVPRDRGASIFHTQCEHVIAHGPSRIRIAHTETANARVLAARVDNALGRRAIPSPLSSSKSSLERSARHTMERATVAIAHSEQARRQGTLAFV